MKKISQTSDDFFTLRCYLTHDGQDVIDAWFSIQSPEIQAAFLTALKTLRGVRRKFWRTALFDELGHGGQTACVGLRRVKIVHKPKGGQPPEQQRILAFEGPGSCELTMLMGFNKDCDPDYSISCPIAQMRKAEVEDDPSRSCECKF